MDTEQGGNGSVRISARDIYDAVQELRREVSALPSVVMYADHEKRIRSLELRWYGILAGLIAGVAAYVARVVK